MEKHKLDGKDKKIIEQLQIHARQPSTEIARKTRLPIDVVKYRIKRMEQAGIIKSYHAFLDSSRLG